MTKVTVSNVQLFNAQLLAYEQSFGLGPQAAGEVVGYEVFAADSGAKLAGGTGSLIQDRFAISQALSKWVPGAVVNIVANVLKISNQKESGFTDLASALAFAFA